MKMNRLIAAAAAAAVLSSGASVFAATDAGHTTKKSQWPTPISDEYNNKDVKTFKNEKPKLTVSDGYDDDYYYGYYYNPGNTLEWSPVDHALLYYVYKKTSSDNSFKLVDKVLGTSYYVGNESASFKVRAVTYDYSDNIVLGALSDSVKVKAKKPPRPRYEDDGVYYETEEEAEAPAVTTMAAAPAGNTTYAADASARVSATKGVGYVPYPYKNTEEYTQYDNNGFKDAAQTPLSTFSANVNTSSYANVRRMTETGRSVPSDAVRIEEMINYFDYNYTAPSGNNVFSVNQELSDCPWNKDAKLLSIGVQAKDLESDPSSNLVFLIDVSGSMYSEDKLPLVVDSIQELTRNLTAEDRVSIVTYSGYERVVLAGAKGNQIKTVSALTDLLEASGSTNGESGINMAYDIATEYFIEGANNRVILATDGDLNVGISDKDELEKFIATKRETGVYLTVLGFGTGNIKDNKMEALAKEGNGNYYYIDTFAEAEKVLTKEKNGTLLTVADDVKLQVEFNPNAVSKYRLIGYDSRRLNNEDFENDQVQADEVGAGQSVTVLYEIIPAKQNVKSSSKGLKYQKATGTKDELCTLKIRYKAPGAESSTEKSYVFRGTNYVPLAQADPRFIVAAAAAEFGMSLKEDYEPSASAEHAKKMLRGMTAEQRAQVGYTDDLVSVIDKHIGNSREDD